MEFKHKTKVLIVDDDPGIRKIFYAMFAELNCEPVVAESGEKGLDEFARKEFDIIFSDINMPPGMDGIEFTRAIRQRNPYIPLILVTGYEPRKLEAEAAGCTDLMHKPVSINVFKEKLEQYVPLRN